MNRTLFKHHSFTCASLALLALLLSQASQAQTAPDAGRLLQEQHREIPLPKTVDFKIEAPSAQRAAPGGPQVMLSNVQFEGNSALDSITLEACLGTASLGKPYDLAGLQDLADKVSACYRAAGYPLARAFVAAQTMEGGNLRLQIIEGRYGEVRLVGDEKAQTAASFLTPLKPGEVITNASLERATLLLSDLPGYWLQPVMQPGEAEGTGDLTLNMQRTDLITGQLGADNMGNLYTGLYRARLDMQVNSPLTAGDQLTVNIVKSAGDMTLGTMAYSFPAWGDGLRLQASLSKTEYRLGDEFTKANAYGASDVASVGMSYSWLRSGGRNLNLNGQIQKKRMHDLKEDLDNQKSSELLTLAINFDQRDDWLGGGVTYGSLSYFSGKLFLDAELLEIDTETLHAAGNFSKLTLDVVRKQALPNDLEANLRFLGQWTDKNLDSSEKLVLGGANGVRAYPTGEALGDKGWLVQAELRGQWEQFSPYLFLDAGAVQKFVRPWDPSASNNRNLAGAGIGIRTTYEDWSADASLAWRMEGGVPQSDPNDRVPRLWVSLNYRF